MHYLLPGILSLLWLGGVVCCLLALWAAWQFRRSAACGAAGFQPRVSLLKPLSGLENGLERNLESFFRQDYRDFEIIFAVNDPQDPALKLVSRLSAKYPRIPVKVVDASASSYANSKVYSLEKMAEQATADILVISDSDVFVGSDYLRSVVIPFADQRVGVSTCVYRGVPGRSIWSKLEALAMSTEFMVGVLLAWKIQGMKFALGPTMIVRRECLKAIGGFSAMADYLADDFVLGSWAARAGYRVVLSPYVVHHQVLDERFRSSFQHRLRWARSSRLSRPWGYIGQVFTYPVPIGLLLAATHPLSLLRGGALVVAVCLRWLVGLAVGWGVLRDGHALRNLWLVPVQDLLSFAVWCGGLTGHHVRWRNISYRVWRGGRFEPLAGRPLPAPSSTLTEPQCVETAAASSPRD
jgi:ceramide glucosyltransferase